VPREGHVEREEAELRRRVHGLKEGTQGRMCWGGHAREEPLERRE
jgi:hypothetical protein